MKRSIWIKPAKGFSFQRVYHHNDSKKLGYEPAGDIFMGPVIIDKTTVTEWKKLIRNIFGDESYDSQDP